MDMFKRSVGSFYTGQGVPNATPAAILDPSFDNPLFKGVRIKAVTGTLYVGPSTVTAATGYQLAAGQEVEIEVDMASKVYVVGTGTYTWIAA